MISKDAIDETIALDDCAMFQCKQGNKQFDIHKYMLFIQQEFQKRGGRGEAFDSISKTVTHFFFILTWTHRRMHARHCVDYIVLSASGRDKNHRCSI